MNSKPLVSINIITYNSSNYILDALESVKEQIYENIELIVSDDCSKDNTVHICEDWIALNGSRFVNAAIITTEKNTGINGNCNRALGASHGEWVKQLAGDDALFSTAIDDFVNFICQNPDAKCVLGNIKEYKNTFDEKNVVDDSQMHFHNNDMILEESADVQFKKFIYGNTFVPPAVFINAQIMRELGGYDEKYGILEDEPFYCKMLKAGYKIYGMNKNVVKYRTSDTNLHGNAVYLFNFKLKQMHFQWQKDMCFPFYSRRERVRSRMFFLTYSLMNKFGMNKKNMINRAVEVSLHFLFALFTLDLCLLKGYFSKVIKN